MGSIEFRIKEVERDVHVIPIAEQANEKGKNKTSANLDVLRIGENKGPTS